jgi:deoxyxylulose-5-phosphate synthase
LLHDAATNGHLVLAIDRAGIVETTAKRIRASSTPPFYHRSCMTLLAPSNYNELRAFCGSSVNQWRRPVACAIRARGGSVAQHYQPTAGPSIISTRKPPLRVVTIRAYLAACPWRRRTRDLPSSVINSTGCCPLDEEAVRARRPTTASSFVKKASPRGIGMQFIARLGLTGYRGTTALRAIEGFVPQGSIDRTLMQLGLDADGIEQLINE